MQRSVIYSAMFCLIVFPFIMPCFSISIFTLIFGFCKRMGLCVHNDYVRSNVMVRTSNPASHHICKYNAWDDISVVHARDACSVEWIKHVGVEYVWIASAEVNRYAWRSASVSCKVVRPHPCWSGRVKRRMCSLYAVSAESSWKRLCNMEGTYMCLCDWIQCINRKLEVAYPSFKRCMRCVSNNW